MLTYVKIVHHIISGFSMERVYTCRPAGALGLGALRGYTHVAPLGLKRRGRNARLYRLRPDGSGLETPPTVGKAFHFFVIFPCLRRDMFA